MGIILDLIVVGIILLSIYLGYKKGLVNMVLRVVTFFLALIISFVLYIPVTNFVISNTQADESVKGFVIEHFSNNESNEVETEEMNTSQVVEKYIKSYTDDVKNKGIEKVAEEISVIIIKVAVFVGLFIIARILLLFVKLFADILTFLPIIKEFNKTGGLLYGVIRGFIIVWVCLAVVAIVLPTTKDTVVGPAIQNSYITKILYDYNVLLMILF